MKSARLCFLSRIFLIAAVIVAGAAAAPVHAQSSSEAPFENDLLRLTEIMGALHFLRPLCGNDDTPSWRERAQSLLQIETTDEDRMRRFAQRFNQGYRGFSITYRDCTPSARLALAQYVDEGETIINKVISRYGR